MRVHVYTDASIGKGFTAIGIVIRWPDDTERPCVQQAQTIRHEGPDSSFAEMRAISIGLDWAIARGHVAAGDIVTLYSDGELAIQWLLGQASRSPKMARRKRGLGYDIRAAAVHVTVKRFGIGFHPVHIKAHQPMGTNTHADHHRIADRIARKALRASISGNAAQPAPDPKPVPEIDHAAMERDAAQKAAYQAKKAAKARAKCGPAKGRRYVPFWEKPGWDDGREPDVQSFIDTAIAARMTNQAAPAIAIPVDVPREHRFAAVLA